MFTIKNNNNELKITKIINISGNKCKFCVDVISGQNLFGKYYIYLNGHYQNKFVIYFHNTLIL